MSQFFLGRKSLDELAGVHPALVATVKRAIQLTAIDFTVFDGLRTPEQQNEMVRSGASRTYASKHLPQADGFSHAVDLVPWIGGKPVWRWEPIYRVAAAMKQAAAEQSLPILWGAVWDKPMADLRAGADGMRRAVEDYKFRHPGPDFIDGPHYELTH